MKKEDLKVKGLSERERFCLEYLAAVLYRNDEACWRRFSTIAEEVKIPENKARIAVRSLKRKGFVSYDKLFDYDGFVAGSGHCISLEGLRFVDAYLKANKINPKEYYEENYL